MNKLIIILNSLLLIALSGITSFSQEIENKLQVQDKSEFDFLENVLYKND